MSTRQRARTMVAVSLAAFLFAGGLISLPGCHKGGHEGHQQEAEKTIYYCPMHPNYTSDKPGQCPICGMNLVPMKDEKKNDGAAVTISSKRQQLIGVKKAKARMADAIKTIRTTGKVAFDAELAVAQREYLEAKKLGDKGFTAAARQRLILMGMSEEQINGLREVQKDLYSPQKKAWVYPVIFENEFSLVKVGQVVKIELPSGGGTREGKVAAIDPVVDGQTRTARLRVEVSNEDGLLRPNMFVNAVIESDMGRKLLVPKSAVITSGERNIVFVVHDTEFMPHEVKLGAELSDDYIIESGISDGDEIVVGANFLIDSESKLKSAIGNMKQHEHGN